MRPAGRGVPGPGFPAAGPSALGCPVPGCPVPGCPGRGPPPPGAAAAGPRGLSRGGEVLRGGELHGGAGLTGDRLACARLLRHARLTRYRLTRRHLRHGRVARRGELPRVLTGQRGGDPGLRRYAYGNTLTLLNRLPRGDLRRGSLPGSHRLCLTRRTLRRNHRARLDRHGLRGLRLRLAHGSATAAGRRARGVRLRRGVVVGLVVRNGVVPPLVTRNATGNLLRSDRNPRCRRLDLRRRIRHPVRLGRRQGEHRARARLLGGGPLGRGREGTPTTPGRLSVLAHLGLGTARGQRGRQRLPFAGRGHALRRHRPAQTRTGGRGPGGMLRRRHHSALGHTVRRTVGPVAGRDFGRPPTPSPGTAGSTVAARFRGRRRLLGRTPSASPGGHRGLTAGVVGARHLALQEGVHGGPPGAPPPAAARGLLGYGEFGATGRDRSGDSARPASDGNLQDVRAAAHPRHVVRLQHTAVRPDDPAHDRLVHRISPAYGPRTSIRTTSPRCAAATTTVLSM